MRKTIKCRSQWGAFWGSPPRWRRSVFSGHADSRRGTEERVSPQSRAVVVFLQLNLNDYWCARHLPLPVSPKKDRAANKGECKESSTRHKTHRKFLQTPDKDTSVFTAACRAGLLSDVSQHQKEECVFPTDKSVSRSCFSTYIYVAYSGASETSNCSPGLNSLCHVSKSLIVCLKNRVVVVVCWIIYNSKQELRFALKRIICNNGIYHGSHCKTKLFALLWSPHQGMQMRIFFLIFLFFSSLHAPTDQHFTQQVGGFIFKSHIKSFLLIIHPF